MWQGDGMPPTRKTPVDPSRAASTQIDIDRVEAVLLDDGWHQVFPRTFNIVGLSFVHAAEKKTAALHNSGAGFTFSERTSSGEIQRIAGPISSMLAFRYTRESDDGDKQN